MDGTAERACALSAAIVSDETPRSVRRTEARAANDAVLALIALGYKQIDAAKSVREAGAKNPGAKTEELVRMALQSLV